ncbi:MAG: hypothetical protein KBD39_07270 [Sterolibacterium sp.]|nr:hypothetical protein [Sterolibacterium sp.]MBP9799903.1 hypothetical protein [Sterolibacterium sp.]
MKIIDIHQTHTLPLLPAASAVVCMGQRLFLIGDSSQYLHLIDEQGQSHRFPLLPGAHPAQEPLSKQQKADFEGLLLDATSEALLVLPSGSEANRLRGMRVCLPAVTDDEPAPGMSAEPVDFAPLFGRVMNYARIDEADVNIEGGGSWGAQRWFLLNRGNGPQARNLIVILEGRDLPDSLPVAQYPLELPVLEDGAGGKGVLASLTDGCIVGDSLYVVAAAEAGASTYHDGEVRGSLIARYDLTHFALQAWCLLPGTMKFEGISLRAVSADGSRITLVLCADNDDPTQAGAVYQVALEVRATAPAAFRPA